MYKNRAAKATRLCSLAKHNFRCLWQKVNYDWEHHQLLHLLPLPVSILVLTGLVLHNYVRLQRILWKQKFRISVSDFLEAYSSYTTRSNTSDHLRN